MKKSITPMRVAAMLVLMFAAMVGFAQATNKLPQNMQTAFKVRTAGTGFTTARFATKPSAAHRVQPLQTTADGTVLYGDVIYADHWTTDGTQYGVSSFEVSSPLTLTAENEDDNFNCNSGAVYRNGEYRILNAHTGSSGTVDYISYYVYDTDSWEEIDENEFTDSYYMATDLAVDPLTNEIYGAFSDGLGGMQLAVADFDRQTYEVRGKLNLYLLALAINSEGKLYAIAQNGMLYSVDKNTAQLTKIGSTGITPATYLQSATFDLLTDKLYWATTLTTDVAGLYEVDTTTGKATLIANFPNNEEVVGLFSKNKLSQDAAPAAPKGLSATFEAASTTGTIAFTLPELSNVGEALSGTLTYTIMANDELVASGQGTPGEQISASVTLKAGDNKIIVTASNSVGKGTPAILNTWVGNDAPSAVTDLSASYADGTVTLTWKYPTTSLHGGYLDEQAISYTITRYPDKQVVAKDYTMTSFAEELNPEELAPYYYEVTAYAGELEGGTAKSNTFAAGQAITPPYEQQFDDEASLSLLTVIDANEDGTAWELNADKGYAMLRYSNDYNVDDWLITPSLKLESERYYKLTFDAYASWGANYPERIAAYYGTAPLPEQLTGEIVPVTTISYIDPVIFANYFSVPTTGNYNVGLQVTSFEQYKLQVDSLIVEVGPKFGAPGAATNFTATADKQGALSVALSFVTPTLTANENALSSLTKVEVYRNEQLISTTDAPALGETLTLTDNAASEGINYYKVVAYNADGEGFPAEAKVYVGEDLPTAPTNIRLQDKGDGKVLITWEAPTVGVNGGYIDSDNLHYGIKNNSNETLETAYNGTSYEAEVDQTGDQAYLMYAIFAANDKGYSESGISNSIVVGAPYSLPFHETFDDDTDTHFWGSTTTTSDSYAYWSTYSGYASFEHGTDGDGAKIFSGKIDLSQASNPVLEFYYWYRAEEGNEPLRIEVYRNGTDTVEIEQLEYTLYMNSKDYELVRLPLKQFKEDSYIQLGFNIANGTSLSRAAIDNISVRDYFANDLQASISGPTEAAVADTIDIAATVKNVGENAVDAYTVELYEASRLVATIDGTALAPDSVKTYAFSVPVGTLKSELRYSIKANYEADNHVADNVTDTLAVSVSLPDYPAPNALTGTADGGTTTLTWATPDYEQYALASVEDVESYDAFIIDNIGDWTVIDVDQLTPRSSISGGGNTLTYDHKGEAMAFIVMNPEKAGAAFTNWWGEPTGWQPVSGNQFFASFGSKAGANDDWLISPELTGSAQTISFQAHGYYSDTYEVLYSTTDKDISSFISLGSKTASRSWEADSYDLPEGAKYFAIRNISYDYPYYLFIDDIKYATAAGIGALSLEGYNVYRNGVKLNDQPLSDTTFADSDLYNGNYEYQVTAVYNVGESVPQTCEVSITTSLNNATTPSNLGIKDIYDVSGRRLSHLQRGINVVRMTDGTVRKLLVK